MWQRPCKAVAKCEPQAKPPGQLKHGTTDKLEVIDEPAYHGAAIKIYFKVLLSAVTTQYFATHKSTAQPHWGLSWRLDR
jgi:hypothetical protein